MAHDPAEITLATLYEDRSGNCWFRARQIGLYRIGSDDTVTRFDEQGGVPPETLVSVVGDDHEGNLWLGTQGQGLVRLKDGRFTHYTTADGLAPGNIMTIVEDREGTLWVGTSGGGLTRITKQFITTRSTKDGLATDNIYPIYEDRAGAIWVGGYGGVSRFSDGAVTNFYDTDFGINPRTQVRYNAYVQSLYQDRRGRFWAGTIDHLFEFKDGKFVAFPLPVTAPINAIREDQAGNFWVGTDNGLVKISEGITTLYRRQDGLPGNEIKVIHEDKKGKLWIGTYGGLAAYEGGRFSALTSKDGLVSNSVRSIYEDADGILWIGTYDSGLSRLKDGRFTSFTTANGLYNSGVFQILEDARGYFWISCNRGIYRVSREQLNDFAGGKLASVTSIADGKSDGMLDAECNGGRQPAGIKTRGGQLWFPTQKGVAIIDPATVPFNTLPPPVLVETVRTDRTLTDFRDGVRVRPGQANLEIGYTGLSFIKPAQVYFRYPLVGQDHDWVEAGPRRTAYYSFLPPGTNTFRVIAANSDGLWNEEGASLRIVVVPPFYRTWWFLTLSALSLMAAAFFAYRARIAQLQRRHAEQEAFARQLIQSQERERKRIAAELHDSLGQNLLLIKNRALFGTLKAATPEEAQAQFAELSDSVGEAIEEVREIAYNLRPYHLDRLGLTQTIEAMIEKVAAASGVEFTTEIPPLEGLLPPEAEISLYRVLQECVNNIARHAQATRARVTIERETQSLTIRVVDNGRGFTPGENHRRAPATQRFNDVPASRPGYAYIDDFAARGITSGCGGGNYCPDAPVTREQMAVFLVRAFGL